MYGLIVRTTIDLPDDLHRAATAIAKDTNRTLSATVSELIRRGLRQPDSPAGPGVQNRAGFPLLFIDSVITAEDVRALDDE